jgi:hypothetical protein
VSILFGRQREIKRCVDWLGAIDHHSTNADTRAIGSSNRGRGNVLARISILEQMFFPDNRVDYTICVVIVTSALATALPLSTGALCRLVGGCGVVAQIKFLIPCAFRVFRVCYEIVYI